MITKYLLIVVILLSQILLVNAAVLDGFVETVTDGDTIKIKSSDKIYIVRLYGIDAPEKNQPYGNNSTKFLKDKIENKHISVNFSSKDKYGRIVGKVYHNETYINEYLIKNGKAWHYKKYSNDKDLNNAENFAKENRLGIWKFESVIAPWDWRKKKTKN